MYKEKKKKLKYTTEQNWPEAKKEESFLVFFTVWAVLYKF